MTILIIEASTEDRNFFAKILKQGGYSTLAYASSPEEAYGMMGIGHENTSAMAFGTELVVIGGAMSEDCIECCLRIKDSFQYQDIPILISAENAPADGMPLALAYGAIDYVRKPCNEYEFLARVRSALRLKHEIDRRKARERELIEATRQLYDLNTMLTRLSLIDSLTGIANRRNFERVMEKEWRRGYRSDGPLGLLMIDVDHFKSYNDHYGHQSGDECLRQVARVLKDALQRPGDIICRYGGEEFAAILPDTPTEGAIIVAEKLRSEMEKTSLPHQHSMVANVVTLSIGAASIKPTKAGTPATLIEQADQALYMAKERGRNRVVAFRRAKSKVKKAG